ncbi:hypothetical protein LDENG_00096220 [Lucifuga dentata]|nr:hypothetical protein LDENG_00096220 [Lucifuga dentata]
MSNHRFQKHHSISCLSVALSALAAHSGVHVQYPDNSTLAWIFVQSQTPPNPTSPHLTRPSPTARRLCHPTGTQILLTTCHGGIFLSIQLTPQKYCMNNILRKSIKRTR